MSRRFRLPITTVASATVSVSISDAKLRELAAERGVSPAELTIEDLSDVIIETCSPPIICAACAGWNRDHSLELGEEWSPYTSSPAALEHEFIEEVTSDTDREE